MSNMGSLWQLTRARILEFVRSPGVIFWVFGFPVLLAVALGLAFRNQPPEPVRAAIVGDGATLATERLEGDDRVKISKLDDEAAAKALRTGKIDIIARIDPGDGPLPHTTYKYDPSRPEARAARLVLGDALERAYGRKDGLASVDETEEEPGGRYIDFLIPGLIGLNIMGSCMWGIGYAVVDARRRKLLKRFAATPMPRSNFLLSFLFSRLVFLIAEVALLALFGFLVFDVRFEGSVAAVGLLSAVGAFAFSGLSLVIAARIESAEVASGWMNFIMLPMWLLSGSFFSYDRFPEVIHPYIKFLPLTALNDALRAVINEGTSIFALLPETGILAAWGLLGFVIALKMFKWQ